ncbi:hypothetical protein SAMN05444411_110141 [Lutibacter oricola]|uniref:Lipoprotein n=1 Tax=Lutibacter oricola TaxID=762486 RepID=A0A1H3F6K3_9FLAO|nr:hypothetical protein [Lutibacter oricola]SDX86560.1 hypothetical protein SAMN05444411_110141 [Lutibacter oricola]
MKNIYKYTLLIITLITTSACPSDEDDCIKTITIPQYYVVFGQSYSTETTQQVPCDYPEPTTPELIEPPAVENLTYEVLEFNFTPDTGNNTSRLQFQIKLNNPNEFSIKGIVVLTLNSDGLEYSGNFSKDATSSCYEISANSNCILTYDKESSLDLGLVNSLQLVNVEYYLTN